VRLNVSVAPYTGEYHKDFNVIRTKVEGQAFIPVIGENSLVLALRAMYGLISDTNAQDVPASIRFYTGGGGSVRGYEYQSLGPRNDSNDPLGGASAVEVGAEARMRFNETWGLVAFLDGGMAYEDAAADITQDELRWGAGIGARIYTAIGPIRLDFAVPLNPRDDDDNFQIYFSIGQSF
jgi:Outer membrane protein